MNTNKIILARGEVTGHSHAVDSRFARTIETTHDNCCALLERTGDDEILVEHEEHNPTPLPKAKRVRVRIVAMYDYLTGLIERVRD